MNAPDKLPLNTASETLPRPISRATAAQMPR